jgi:hypothetical protein
MLSGEATNQFYNLWFDPNGTQTHDLPHANHYATDAVDISMIFLSNTKAFNK